MSHWKSAWVRRRTRRNSTLEDRPRSSVGGSLNGRISLGTPSLFRLCQTRRDSGELGSVWLHGPWVFLLLRFAPLTDSITLSLELTLSNSLFSLSQSPSPFLCFSLSDPPDLSLNLSQSLISISSLTLSHHSLSLGQKEEQRRKEEQRKKNGGCA
jgi:hypothetical protein